VKYSARTLAVKILSSWHKTPKKQRRPLSDICNENLQKITLSPNDRNLVYQLCLGSVRWLYLIDWLLEKRLSKPLKTLPLKLRSILEIGLYQILFLDKIPIFAAINEAVEFVKQDKSIKWATGLVNAVLRRSISYKEQLHTKMPFNIDLQSVDGISIATSHPKWMVKRWVKRLGIKNTINLCNANNTIAPLTLRVNTLRCIKDELIKLFREKNITVYEGELSPDAILVFDFKGHISSLPGYKEGLFQVQDEAAQIVSFILDPQKGQNILDVCAGVGGKTTHIAQLTLDSANILALDKNNNKLKILKENAKRLGINSICVCNSENFLKNYNSNYHYFDRILIDAPCSGLGVIRRHPDIKWNKDISDINFLAKIQLALLNNYASFLKKDGLLVYSTCTLEPEETEEVIKHFLDSKLGKDFVLFTPKNIPKSIKPKSGILFTYPSPSHKSCDGFFIACLKRINC